MGTNNNKTTEPQQSSPTEASGNSVDIIADNPTAEQSKETKPKPKSDKQTSFKTSGQQGLFGKSEPNPVASLEKKIEQLLDAPPSEQNPQDFAIQMIKLYEYASEKSNPAAATQFLKFRETVDQERFATFKDKFPDVSELLEANPVQAAKLFKPDHDRLCNLFTAYKEQTLELENQSDNDLSEQTKDTSTLGASG